MKYRPLSGIILVAFCLTPFTIFSQSVKIGFRLKADTVEVDEYQFSDLGGSQTYLQMPYGGYQIMNPGAYKIFHGKHLEKIELVYTDHPLGVDLKQLNKKRIASLYLLAPEVFNDRSTEWKFVKQTETENKDVYIVIYLDGGGDCGLGHFRFLENEEQAQSLLDSVGHLMVAKGRVIGETKPSRWEAE